MHGQLIIIARKLSSFSHLAAKHIHKHTLRNNEWKAYTHSAYNFPLNFDLLSMVPHNASHTVKYIVSLSLLRIVCANNSVSDLQVNMPRYMPHSSKKIFWHSKKGSFGLYYVMTDSLDQRLREEGVSSRNCNDWAWLCWLVVNQKFNLHPQKKFLCTTKSALWNAALKIDTQESSYLPASVCNQELSWHKRREALN